MQIRKDWLKRLEKIVGARGGNLKALSIASGLNATFLRDTFKKGTTPGMASAQKLSKGLSVDLSEWFFEEVSGTSEVKPHNQGVIDRPSADHESSSTLLTNNDRQALAQRGTYDKVPVLGMAECGPDGLALWNGEVVDYASRPPGLMGVEKGYAVFVVGDSMEPRYHPGELVYIHPGKPVTPGCYVLVQMQPKHDGEAPRAFLKRLVRRNGSKVMVEQFQPAKQFNLKPDEIVSMHRVVGSGEA